MGGQCGLSEFQSFGGTIRHEQQARVMALIAPSKLMVGAERLLADGNSATEERFGLVHPPRIAQQAPKVAEAQRRTGMLGAEHLLLDRQRALEQRPRARRVALVLKQEGEVAEAQRRTGMVRSCVAYFSAAFSFVSSAIFWASMISASRRFVALTMLAAIPARQRLPQLQWVRFVSDQVAGEKTGPLRVRLSRRHRADYHLPEGNT
jgi:hypothetical protein